MSWLRNHMRHFVIPGIRAIARANGKALTDLDLRPDDKILRPSAKCEYVEAGMLYALVSSILPKSSETREVALGLCRQVGRPGDAQFVYELDLGKSYDKGRVRELGDGYDGVEGADVLHSFIQNSVKELKRRTKRQRVAIYPGRDVWSWEVMSRRQGMPSLYDSRVSRSIATNPRAIKKAIEPWQIQDWGKTVLFDSGHEGTVPRAIGKAAGLEKMLVIMLSAVRNEEQIFRKHAKSRKKALACEYLAKYHQRATVRDDAPYQELATLEEFIKAALLTIWLWYHVSPARLPSWRDAPSEPKRDSGGITIVPTTSNALVVSPSAWAAPIWINSGSSSTGSMYLSGANTSISTAGWDQFGITTASGFYDPYGSASPSNQVLADQVDQQRAKIKELEAQLKAHQSNVSAPVNAVLDPNTFQLVDPVSNAPLQAAMDAKNLGLDPVQYEVGRARHAALERAKQDLTGMNYAAKPVDKKLFTMLDINGPPYGPPSVQHSINVDKHSGQAIRQTILSQSLPGSLQPNTSSQPSQGPGGPGGGKAITPTTTGAGMKVVPIPAVTDGAGKPLTF